jgi:sigma-E factor negative regulatory protein RseC
MIEARAVVMRVERDRAWVRVSDRADGCGRCDEPGGCRATRIAYAFKAPGEVFSVPNRIGVGEGEHVRILIEDGAPLRGALASYGLGACLLLAGAAAGNGIAPAGEAGLADLYALAGASAGLVLAFVINRFLLRSSRWRRALRIEMVVDREPCGQHGVRA